MFWHRIFLYSLTTREGNGLRSYQIYQMSFYGNYPLFKQIKFRKCVSLNQECVFWKVICVYVRCLWILLNRTKTCTTLNFNSTGHCENEKTLISFAHFWNFPTIFPKYRRYICFYLNNFLQKFVPRQIRGQMEQDFPLMWYFGAFYSSKNSIYW